MLYVGVALVLCDGLAPQIDPRTIAQVLLRIHPLSAAHAPDQKTGEDLIAAAHEATYV
jgi:hypothetical protein